MNITNTLSGLLVPWIFWLKQWKPWDIVLDGSPSLHINMPGYVCDLFYGEDFKNI